MHLLDLGKPSHEMIIDAGTRKIVSLLRKEEPNQFVLSSLAGIRDRETGKGEPQTVMCHVGITFNFNSLAFEISVDLICYQFWTSDSRRSPLERQNCSVV